MAKKKNWYAIWGSNGLGIYSTWKKAQESQRYLEMSNAKGFKVFSEAKCKALKEYNECSGDDFQGPEPINFTIRREHIDAIKKSGLSADAKIKVVFKDKEPNFEEVCV